MQVWPTTRPFEQPRSGQVSLHCDPLQIPGLGAGSWDPHIWLVLLVRALVIPVAEKPLGW